MTILKRLNRDQMAWRATRDIPNGSVVNLGIGLPELVANHVAADQEVIFHSENGILGMGSVADNGKEDFDLVSAGKKPITVVPGAAYFDSALSFAMIRGGHIDIAVLGAFQVSRFGDLANWSTGEKHSIPAVGGAMDLAAGAKKIFVITTHTTRDGTPKIVENCTYPLTGERAVKTIYTDLAVIELSETGPIVREMISGMDLDTLQAQSNTQLAIDPNCKELKAPLAIGSSSAKKL
jgi:3-oxoadipate CoA-transferase beta subunit